MTNAFKKVIVVTLAVLFIGFPLFALVFLPGKVETDSSSIPDEPVEQLSEYANAEILVGGASEPRSTKWPSVRDSFVREHPECEACGGTADLNVHHVQPFHEHPELELDRNNLITLCREHHFRIGHDPDGPDGPRKADWKLSNPNVRRDCKKLRVGL